MYTFSSEGIYTLRILSDYDPDPEIGEWRLTPDDKGKVHLTLKNKTGRYYWLPQDCIIEYDKTTDSMPVSGGHFEGTQKLEKIVQHKPST